MMPILDIILLRAPQYGGNPRIDGLISLAMMLTNANYLKEKFNYAVALRVLHWLAVEAINGGDSTTSSGSGQGSVLSSASEDSLSVSYAVNSSSNGSNDALGMTVYGKELQSLLKGCIFAPRTGKSQ